jgi:hypothetical protein
VVLDSARETRRTAAAIAGFPSSATLTASSTDRILCALAGVLSGAAWTAIPLRTTQERQSAITKGAAIRLVFTGQLHNGKGITYPDATMRAPESMGGFEQARFEE